MTGNKDRNQWVDVAKYTEKLRKETGLSIHTMKKEDDQTLLAIQDMFKRTAMNEMPKTSGIQRVLRAISNLLRFKR